MNLNGMGSEMYPESPFKPHQPDNEKAYRTTKGSLYDGVSQTLSDNFGRKYADDWADVSPEVLKYWTSTLTGGAGRFVFDSMGLVNTLAQGAPVGHSDVPLWRKGFGNVDIRGARSQFYERREEITEALAEYNAARKAADLELAAKIRAENRELFAMAKQADAMQELIKAKRNYQDQIRQSDLTLAEKKLKLAEIEKAEAAIYERFDKIWDTRMAQRDARDDAEE
jgi:hypothetical protein